MKFFIDTADISVIQKALETGLIDGVTTNPSLASKTSIPYRQMAQEIFELVEGDVSVEVLSTEYTGMINEAQDIVSWAGEKGNAVVKLPMTIDGIKAAGYLSKKNIKTNITLVFSPAQALLAAKAGATYVSPFVGRLHDSGHDGIELISEIRQIFDNYNFSTEILVASDRTVMDTVNSALIGADVITLKPDNFWKLFKHPYTDIGLEKFLEDWNNSENS